MAESALALEQPQSLADSEIDRLIRAAADESFVARAIGPTKQNTAFRPRSLMELARAAMDGNTHDRQDGQAPPDNTPGGPGADHANTVAKPAGPADVPCLDRAATDPPKPDETTGSDGTAAPAAPPDQPDDADNPDPDRPDARSLDAEQTERKIAAAHREGFDHGWAEGTARSEHGLAQAVSAFEAAVAGLIVPDAHHTELLTKTVATAVTALASHRAGQAIDTLPEPFLKRIELLSDRVTQSVRTAKICLNPDDLNAVLPHLDTSELLRDCQVVGTARLARGEIDISAEGIRLCDITEFPLLLKEPEFME